MSQKPRVLVLGGLNVCSGQLLRYLVAPEGKPDLLVSPLEVPAKSCAYSLDFYVFIAYASNLLASVSYLGSRVRAVFDNPIIEYRQANLAIPNIVSSVFEPPSSGASELSWDIVFDFTGEIRYERSDDHHLQQTAKVAQLLGQEAAKRKVGAYVRITHPFYHTSTSDKPSKEKDRAKGLTKEHEGVKPASVRGYWWHEALRALAAIQGLNLVIVRVGAAYGPQQTFGTVHSRIIVGRVYQYRQWEMKYLWTPGLRYNTVHAWDVAGAVWEVGKWMLATGRAQADEIAGETIQHFPAKAKDVEEKAAAFLDTKIEPKAPLFNLVDDGDTTLKDIGEAISEVLELDFSFYGMLTNASMSIKKDLQDIANETNDEHMESWGELILNSSPPVPLTPLTPFVDTHYLYKYSVAYSNEKLKRIIGYKFKYPKFGAEQVGDIVRSFQEEGTWPN
ncbi:uncharacterized protein EI90DRAFT_3147090 [Cantharellus anzutake]|uniref:uncharacterized protein n=1 Tax=Cantharellus anzutake TaxID=1750568 RepID=UPI0019049211|nr:uncharacterized protein EI90DRAFT_3147090 [Cantharellus anzutake]KAF8321445.1 hypothetical protein EI90DRAFT_3147090 [Cantharellus anzutake]